MPVVPLVSWQPPLLGWALAAQVRLTTPLASRLIVNVLLLDEAATTEYVVAVPTSGRERRAGCVGQGRLDAPREPPS